MSSIINDDVVISGVGGYFPKAYNIREFQDRLFSNEDLMDSRWPKGERGVTNIIGRISNEYFDNAHFGIHRTQCTYMDPMHRLTLERTYEALIDAGVNPSEIRGKRIACFMGSSIGENDNLFLESIMSGFGITGHSRAMMPNRISYWLDLKGPSIAYDSNWLNGIEVIRLAYEAIKHGECDGVIVGCANLVLNSEFQWLYNDMGLLSDEGTTRSFDVDGKGYTRSDGVVVLYIQRASQARRFYASIVHAATQFDGNHNNPLTEINTKNLASFIDNFYKDCNFNPTNVEFVEAYGCGLKETDKREVDALELAYCKNRKNPLLIGSVKSNAGHAEATASLFSVVKVLIAMETEMIPATIHCDTPNHEIGAFASGRIKVVTENQKWGAKYAAVNSIGLTSGYGHILLKANEKKKIVKEDDIPRLVIASTRTKEGMDTILEMVQNKEEIDVEYVKLLQELFSRPIANHIYRGYTILGGKENKKESEYHLGNKRQIWFVYSGMGSQWCGMISDLMKFHIFAKAINHCHEILAKKGLNLLEIVSSNDKKIFDNILHSFVGIAAMQIGLTDLLKAMGIVPDGIIGHSVGELGCAYGDGCMTAEQMILSAYSRGKASLEATLIKGMMAAIGLGYNKMKDMVPPSIEVACHNGPDSSTISGPTEDMEVFVKELQDKGIFARLVNVSNIAYHSRYIKPAAPSLLEKLKEVLPVPMVRSSKWVSTSNKEEDWDTDLAKHSSAEYHTNNLLSSVLFEEGLQLIPKDSVLIEIAPHGLLQAILKRSLKTGCTNVPLTLRGTNSAAEFLLSSVGKLYLAGLNMDVSVLYPKIEFPVGKGTDSLANITHWEHSEKWRTGLEDQIKALYGVKECSITLNSEEFRDSVGHQMDDKIILPYTCFLNVILDIISTMSTGHNELIFENLYFKRPITIPKIGSVPIHAMIQKGTGAFEILTGTEIVVTGRLFYPTNPGDKFMIDTTDVQVDEENIELSAHDLYSEFAHRGCKYSGKFKAIKNITLSENGSVATSKWIDNWFTFLEAMFQQHFFHDGEERQDIFVPKLVEHIFIDLKELPKEPTDLIVHYDYSTNLITTKGIQIAGMKNVRMPRERKPISFECVDFVPLRNRSFQGIQEAIEVAVALTLDNFGDIISNIIVTEIQGRNASLLEPVKEALKYHTKINSNVSSITDVKSIVIQNADPLLFISNDTINEDLVHVIASSHGFLLLRTDSNIKSYSQVTEIAQFNVNGIGYSILRRKNTNTPIVLHVKGDTLTAKQLNNETTVWVNELITAAAVAKSKQNNVFLVSSVIPTEGIVNFTNELLTLSQLSAVRLLFTINTPADVVSSMSKKVFEDNLKLSVIDDGVFGSVLPVTAKLDIETLQKLGSSRNSSVNSKVNIKFLGVNLKDETILPESLRNPKLGLFDYSGTATSKETVMGLAQFDSDNCNLELDPVFQWKVSNRWTLEDAATVPYAYISAYYCLLKKGKLVPGETVLIHSGCSPIGQAAIAIASFMGCNIFTSVSNDSQRCYLKRVFNALDDLHILDANNSQFEPFLKIATHGKGANVVINNLSGGLLQASVDCLASFGRLVQIGKFDLEENNIIGMSIFLKNASFSVVSLNNLSALPRDLKLELRDCVQKGMDIFCVRPLTRKVMEQHNVTEALVNLNKPSNIGKIVIKTDDNLSLNNFILYNPSQFTCFAKNSYLVYGGTSDVWVNVVEWLIHRGARKIVVASEFKPQNVYINRRLSLLQSYFNSEILFTSPKGNTRDGACELLTDLYHLGPIHAVVTLPMKNHVPKMADVKHLQYLDKALRTTAPKAVLINFNASAAGICHFRSEAGFSTFNVQWDEDLEFSDALLGLDEILSYKLKNVFIKNEKISDTAQESAQALFKKLTLLLPSSIEEFIEEIKLAPPTPELVQVTTLGPRITRELPPIFVIPGLSGQKEMREMCLNFLYPTYCAILPSKPMSIKELAVNLVQKIKNIWPKKVYNIVGLSWGGALTIEIARLLAKEGASLHLYFIDGAPVTLQSSIKQLGEDVASMETNLLTRILNTNEADVIKNMNNASSWQERIQFAMDNFKSGDVNKDSLADSLLTLKSNLQELQNFHPVDELVPGQVHLIRPIGSNEYDSCGLLSYCKLIPQIQLVGGDHLSIIRNKETTEYINGRHYVI